MLTLETLAASKKRRNCRLKCDCGAYHFPHRKSGGACYHGSRSAYYIALRNGASVEEAMQLLSERDLDLLFPLPPDSQPANDEDIPL